MISRNYRYKKRMQKLCKDLANSYEEFFYKALTEPKVQDNNVYTLCDNCKFRGIDGGPSPAMVCNKSNDDTWGHIISWKTFGNVQHRVSLKCPLPEDEQIKII